MICHVPLTKEKQDVDDEAINGDGFYDYERDIDYETREGGSQFGLHDTYVSWKDMKPYLGERITVIEHDTYEKDIDYETREGGSQFGLHDTYVSWKDMKPYFGERYVSHPRLAAETSGCGFIRGSQNIH
uniref:Uncharacterized protein n=1 Tax=Lactuca sativa TaxID=4236 RepID=A0A9R1XX74_LACSA|nr:hypothetical protein LSAT_V11C100048200 [Lactuca sativa]